MADIRIGKFDTGENNPENLGRGITYNIETYQDANSQRNNQPYLVDLVTLEKLVFQTIPTQLDYSTESVFAALESPSRNNPLYHYTGAEDIIQFTLSWYSNHSSREDVIRKCKWIIALTKTDGYNGGIHPVKFVFGELFKNSKWIVTSAPYVMRTFDREFGMYPRHAEQTITLRKISEVNILRAEQLNPNY